MAANVGKVYPSDVYLLKKEIEVQGELLNREYLERKTDIDYLRLEVRTLVRLLDQINPGFEKQWHELYEEEKQTWNPEAEAG